MSRLLNIILSLLLFSAAVFSCEKAKKDAPVNSDDRMLSFDRERVEVPCTENRFSLRVSANFDYVVGFDVDWIREDKTSSSTLVRYFIVSENVMKEARTGEIRFTDVADRYYVKTVKVVQAAGPGPRPDMTMSIVDKDATAGTKALLGNLWAIADRGWMFGHHDDLIYGRYWYGEPGGSDTKAVCGDYPALFSVDLAEIMEGRAGADDEALRRRAILEAGERGEVILACAHLSNPLTGGNYKDNSSDKVAKEILTAGTAGRTKFLSWLDRCAAFAGSLKDSRGRLIPVMFRPFHEHTQNWPWWGSSCTTDAEFAALWKFTVEYLRDTKGVHNFLYVISPQMDANYSGNTRGRLLYRWPGDEYVDVLGMDCYHGTNNKAFVSNLKALEEVSRDKKKPCGVTEAGIESFTQKEYWSDYLAAPLKDRRISFVSMWRNKYVGGNESDKHYFSVYPGHPSEDDFRKVYALPESLFSKDLPDMYTLPKGYEIK